MVNLYVVISTIFLNSINKKVAFFLGLIDYCRLLVKTFVERGAVVLRDNLSDALKVALKTQDKASLGTIRLILASIKDQDISVRADGNSEGVSDAQILSLLQTMVKQRNESIRLYEDAGRHDLADQEKNEITVIQRFMPKQLGDEEVESVIKDAIKKIDAKSLKDMGKAMGYLKERYPGQIDFSKASIVVRNILEN